jgi:glycosyl transferase, family 25
MRAYLINLPDASERRQRSCSELEAAGLTCTLIEAIRGAHISYPHPSFAERSYILRQGRRRIDAEVGCYLSHLKAIQAFLDGGDDYGIILEDDILLPAQFRSLIEKAISLGGFDMLRLSSVNSGRWTRTITLDDHYAMGVAFSREKGAGAYLLNRKAALKIVGHYLPMTLPYDHRLDQEWLDGFRTMGISPPPVRQEGFSSQIQRKIRSYYLPAYLRYWSVFPYRVSVELARVLSRSSAYFRLRASR